MMALLLKNGVLLKNTLQGHLLVQWVLIAIGAFIHVRWWWGGGGGAYCNEGASLNHYNGNHNENFNVVCVKGFHERNCNCFYFLIEFM